MSAPRPGGVLFDMDGTLVDTEPLWHAAQFRLSADAGIAWSQRDSDELTGRPMAQWAARMRGRGHPEPEDAIIARAVAMVAEAVTADGAPWLPGARDLLRAVASAGVPSALVTNAGAPNAAAILAAAPAGSLSFAVTDADVTHAKPHPEPYAVAVERLGIDPRRSVAFEDSPSGARSAHDAGLTVWFVTTHTAEPGVPAGRVLTSLADVTIDELRAAIGAG